MSGPERTARRVTMHEARRAFEAGQEILVSEYGREPTVAVGGTSTTHTNRTTTWTALRRQVDEWRGRYPNQRYYIVDPPPDRNPQAGDAVRLAAPWPGVSEVVVGAVGVIDGMVGEELDHPSITFNASTYRDERVVRCSGGPATIATPTSELHASGDMTNVSCWRFRGGVRRPGNDEHFQQHVPLWDWFPGAGSIPQCPDDNDGEEHWRTLLVVEVLSMHGPYDDDLEYLAGAIRDREVAAAVLTRISTPVDDPGVYVAALPYLCTATGTPAELDEPHEYWHDPDSIPGSRADGYCLRTEAHRVHKEQPA